MYLNCLDDVISMSDEVEVTTNGFAEFELLPSIQAAIVQRGYTEPTVIQAETIPHILAGRDVVGQAETGTGKTAAFALPLLSRIDVSIRAPQVLVLAPTRELAIQVAEAFETYGKDLKGLRIATVYGGQGFATQISQLKGGAQIVVGTPGRVMDHMRRGLLKLDALATFALDEADEMLKMGFADDVQWILSHAPDARQTLLFSATLPNAVRNIASKYLRDPIHITAKSKTMTAATVSQRVVAVNPREKLSTLGRILEAETTEGVIVFVKTKETSSRLAEGLCQRGYLASALNGDMQQQQRERTVERLKSGKLNIVVATDVAARGLDVERISHVINYDFPHDTEAYVHRIGRTGRAGREGIAILFMNPREKHRLRILEKVTRQKMTWMDRPTNETILTTRTTRLFEKLKTTMANKKVMAQHTTMIAKYITENPEVPVEELAAALAVIAMGGDRVVEEEREERRSHDRGDFRGGRNGGDRDGFRKGGRDFSKGKRFERSGSRAASGPMAKYRIEVGRAHGVRPGNIVGAIANESGLSGSDIGGIDIQTHFSTVDLPQTLSDEQMQGLRQLRVAGQALRISKWDRTGASDGQFAEKPRRFNKKKSGSKPTWKKSRKPEGASAS